MRERLKENDILNLESYTSEKTFYISSCVGEGASCIVYDGYWFDDLDLIHNVRIKELYPISACHDDRNINDIIWNDEGDKKRSFDQFENTYKKQVTLQAKTGTSNSGSSIIDNIYIGNNTKYIIMDYDDGITFAMKQYSSLQDILETVLALTKFVKKYHDKGYLLMDIKPENFLVIDETNQMIKYLDYDSIIHKV